MRSYLPANKAARTAIPVVTGVVVVYAVVKFVQRWWKNSNVAEKVVACKCYPRLFDKVVVITGATSGIGYEVALMAAQQRATVIFGARDTACGEAVAKKIRAKSDNDRVFSLYLDLNDLKSCRDFCDRILRMEPIVDFLINNAAVFNQKPGLTKNGFERTWQTNYLGPVVITENFLSKVGSGFSDTGRVIFVSSQARLAVQPKDLMEISQMKTVPTIRDMDDAIRHYALTKLALWVYATYHAFSISRHRRYSVISVDPGNVWTNMYRSCWLNFLGYFKRLQCALLMRSPKEGAQTVIHCMNYPLLRNGLLMKDCREAGGPSSDDLEYSPTFVARTHSLVSEFLPPTIKVREDVALFQDQSFDETDEKSSVAHCV